MNDIKALIACAIEIYRKKGEEIPEPVDKDHFKGKILYRIDSERHYLIAKTAQRMHKIDILDESKTFRLKRMGRDKFCCCL